MTAAAVWILVVACVVLSGMGLACVRQLAVVLRRLPDPDEGGTPGQLGPGAPCPVTTMQRVGGGDLVLADGEPRILLFASFTCAICRPLMGRLHELPAALTSRLVVCLLDAESGERFARDIDELNLRALPLVEGAPHSDAFAISKAPFLYALAADGTIARGRTLRTLETLRDELRSLT